MAAPSAASEIPKLFPKVLHKYVGNGTMFQFLKPYEGKYKLVATLNSVYNVAPLSKWGLSIVPMYGVFTGYPAPQDIDFNTSLSLALTGSVWTVYACLIQPQNAGSRALATVNCAMACVNGFNAYRKNYYDKHVTQDIEGRTIGVEETKPAAPAAVTK
jgi:mitochondrial pyruvate carrier 2